MRDVLLVRLVPVVRCLQLPTFAPSSTPHPHNPPGTRRSPVGRILFALYFGVNHVPDVHHLSVSDRCLLEPCIVTRDLRFHLFFSWYTGLSVCIVFFIFMFSGQAPREALFPCACDCFVAIAPNSFAFPVCCLPGQTPCAGPLAALKCCPYILTPQEPVDAAHHQSYEDWVEMEDTRSLAPIAERTLSGRGSTELTDASSLLAAASSFRGDGAGAYPNNQEVMSRRTLLRSPLASPPSSERNSESMPAVPWTPSREMAGGVGGLESASGDVSGGGEVENEEASDDAGATRLEAGSGLRGVSEGQLGVGTKDSRQDDNSEEKKPEGKNKLEHEVGGGESSAPVSDVAGAAHGSVTDGKRGQEHVGAADARAWETAALESRWISKPGSTFSERAMVPRSPAAQVGPGASDRRAVAAGRYDVEQEEVSSERRVETVARAQPGNHSLHTDTLLMPQQVSGSSPVANVESVRAKGAENDAEESQEAGADYPPGIRTAGNSSGGDLGMRVGDDGGADDTARFVAVQEKLSPFDGSNFIELCELETQKVLNTFSLQGAQAMQHPASTTLSAVHAAHESKMRIHEEIDEVTSVVFSSSEKMIASQAASPGGALSSGDVLKDGSESMVDVNVVSFHGEHTLAPMDASEVNEVVGFQSAFQTNETKAAFDISEMQLTGTGYNASDDLNRLAEDEGSERVMPRALRAMRRMHHLIQTTRDIQENQ